MKTTMTIHEIAQKFIDGETFKQIIRHGESDYISKDHTGCIRWSCDGDIVAVRRPEDGAIAFNTSSWYGHTKDRIKAIKQIMYV